MTALDELLQRWLPDPSSSSSTASVSVVGAGSDRPVTVIGVGRLLLQVARLDGAALPFAVADRPVLRVVLGDGTRIDAPVEVAGRGRVAMVLRLLGAPVVLRRRVIRDRRLEEALDVPRPAADDRPLVA